jgi:large subunit ribosomal protein L5
MTDEKTLEQDTLTDDAQTAAEEQPAAAAEEQPAAAAEEQPAAAAEEQPAPRPRRRVEPTAASPGQNEGLHSRYRTEVIPTLLKEFGYGNPMEVPRLSKIVINIGLGEALTNAKALDAAVGDLATITGQKPIVTRARRSIAQFRVRTGNPIGAKVTLRGQRMWDFLERLTRLALPRIRDFRGVPTKSFDGRGNYSLGLREQLAFPEIDYDKIDRLRGLEVSIVTTAKTDEESKRLLQLLGMPFAS